MAPAGKNPSDAHATEYRSLEKQLLKNGQKRFSKNGQIRPFHGQSGNPGLDRRSTGEHEHRLIFLLRVRKQY